MLDLECIYAYPARGRWFRHTSTQGQFSIGAQRYNAGKGLAGQQLEITFDPQTRKLVCRSEDGEKEMRFLIQGLTKSNLMEDLAPMVTLPLYQLALPFTTEA